MYIYIYIYVYICIYIYTCRYVICVCVNTAGKTTNVTYNIVSCSLIFLSRWQKLIEGILSFCMMSCTIHSLENFNMLLIF